jgi:hypothetical protein
VRYDTTADRAFAEVALSPEPLSRLSICILVMKNGFVVVGTHAPASTETFDPELSRQRAYEHAIIQLWPLMDFAMRGTASATGRT